MNENFNKIKKYLDKNEIISSSQINSFGINRMSIKKYLDNGLLEKVQRGIYSLPNEFIDEYKLLQSRSSKLIFSYGTALFFWGMTDKNPQIIDITIPQATNISAIKKNNSNLRFHYINLTLYQIGITQTKSPQGGIVKLYDKERCICDLIKNKTKIDMQLYTQAIKEYFKNPNFRKLLKYAKIFNIENKIRSYMEVL